MSASSMETTMDGANGTPQSSQASQKLTTAEEELSDLRKAKAALTEAGTLAFVDLTVRQH